MNHFVWPIALLAWWPELPPEPPRVRSLPNHRQAAAKQAARRYAEGPLRVTDFRAAPPTEPVPGSPSLQAFTQTDFRFTWKYTISRRNRRFHLKATTIDLYGVVVRDRSWNRAPDNQRLLDHEQGHFDITETAIRQARLKLQEPMSRRLIRASGNTLKRALRRLEENVLQFLEPFAAETRKRHTHYDRVTGHGKNSAAQHRERMRQKNDLDRLAKQLRVLPGTTHSPE